MKHQVIAQKAQTIFSLSGVPAQAAGISMSDVTTSSGGKFVKRDGKWMYRQKDGSYAKDCLLKINGKTCCFSKNGYRQSGWKKLEGDYYYFGKQSEGYLYRLRWLKLGKQTYFLKKSGKRATGWLTWQGKKYYFNQKGQRLSGWQTIQKKKYYLGTASQGYLYRNRLFTYKKYTFYLQNNAHHQRRNMLLQREGHTAAYRCEPEYRFQMCDPDRRQYRQGALLQKCNGKACQRQHNQDHDLHSGTGKRILK